MLGIGIPNASQLRNVGFDSFTVVFWGCNIILAGTAQKYWFFLLVIHKNIHQMYVTLPYITSHLQYITLHYITLHYVTLHYITLQYITLQHITLH